MKTHVLVLASLLATQTLAAQERTRREGGAPSGAQPATPVQLPAIPFDAARPFTGVWEGRFFPERNESVPMIVVIEFLNGSYSGYQMINTASSPAPHLVVRVEGDSIVWEQRNSGGGFLVYTGRLTGQEALNGVLSFRALPFVASPTLPCREVVGVVNNARRRSIREETGQALMQYYVPFGQLPKPPVEASSGPEIWALLVRVADAEAMAGPVRRLLQSFAPNLPYAEVRPLQDVLDRQMRSWQLGATMFSMFGVLALVLAGVGMYGVRAYAVAQRTREIGVRMALGADVRSVVRQILMEGLRLTLAGVVAGAVTVLLLGRWIESLLFETRAAHPGVLVTVGATLVLIALAGSAVPSLRAARVDPNVALRLD